MKEEETTMKACDLYPHLDQSHRQILAVELSCPVAVAAEVVDTAEKPQSVVGERNPIH